MPFTLRPSRTGKRLKKGFCGEGPIRIQVKKVRGALYIFKGGLEDARMIQKLACERGGLEGHPTLPPL
mgnify:CR=1 FL=1